MLARIRDIALIVMASGFTLMCLVVIVIAILLYAPLRDTVHTLNETAAALKGVAESVEGAVSNVEATMDNIRQASENAADAADRIVQEGLKLAVDDLEQVNPPVNPGN